MKTLLLLFAALSALLVKSQTSVYHPFPDSNACWNVYMTQGMCFMGGFISEDYSLTISGDTTINSQTYHKLTTPYIQATITGGCIQQNFPDYQGAFRQGQYCTIDKQLPPKSPISLLKIIFRFSFNRF